MGRVSMPQGKGSQMHNRREYEKYGKPIPDNIDVSKSHENITLVNKDIKEAYREIFGDALEKYNGKQKRADRKIESYYNHIQKSKNGEKLFYEDVLQWGKKEDFKNPETRERAKEALVKYVEGFEERNPNLKLIGAYIHMDEASPHLHLDYVPVAHGYTRGLATRNSLDRAMKEMGYQPEKESRKNNATKLWKENERSIFGEICRNMGLEVEAERKARGSLSVEEYKEARDAMMSEIEQEKEQATLAMAEMQQQADRIAQEAQKSIQEAQERLLEAFPEEFSIESIIEHKTVKTGLLRQEEVLIAKKPEIIQTAVEDAAALALRLRQTEKHLRQTEKQLEQVKAQLREAQQQADYYKPYYQECRYREIAKDLAEEKRDLLKYALSPEWRLIEPYYTQECNILAYKEQETKKQRYRQRERER